MKISQELVDYVIDFVHDHIATIKSFSLVSKSCAISTRCHIFAAITFHSHRTLEKWAEEFRSPKNSPAHYVRTLTIIENPKWPSYSPASMKPFMKHFAAFNKVQHLRCRALNLEMFESRSLHSYFGHFASSLRSLNLMLPDRVPHIYSHFLCLFPQLDDVSAERDANWNIDVSDQKDTLRLRSSPSLRGYLSLSRCQHIIPTLLVLPGGLRFNALDLTTSHLESAAEKPVNQLLLACASTLECIRLAEFQRHDSLLDPVGELNLRQAVALRHLTLSIQGNYHSTIWINTLLSSITSSVLSTLKFELTFTSPGRWTDFGPWMDHTTERIILGLRDRGLQNVILDVRRELNRSDIRDGCGTNWSYVVECATKAFPNLADLGILTLVPGYPFSLYFGIN